jgi:hypothetical protein
MAGDDGVAITTIEARLLAASMGALQSDVAEMRASMKSMERAMESLVRIDEQQSNQRAAIGRAFDEIKDERKARETMAERVHLLEVDAPSYKELRRWVVGGVLTGIMALLAALFTIVFKVIISDPIERNFRPPPSAQTAPQSYDGR